MPRREDMTPRDFAGLLRNAALLKVVDNGQDFEFRIVGDAHIEAHGIDVLGKRLPALDAFSPGYGEALRAVCTRVRDHARPSALRGWFGPRKDPHGSLQHESVFLPFGNGPMTDHILIVSVYMRGDGLSYPPNRTR